ncbi:hypothetical protein P0O15_00655 [Methanotrichaceae archaeon Mx]|uniref:TolC family protein n=1 Tax=Candidatus Methanocrinis natronophilus TaxID=3033396 RepID=A0ABT5X4S1_9EURY|nr:hypothetical protein [Candidatus Methanocrinis natronophilus]
MHEIGRGKSLGVINLEVGARQSSQAHYMGSSGFAAPTTPQPMLLSAGSMVNQAKRYMSQAEVARDQAQEQYDKTLLLARQVEERSKLVDESLSASKEHLDLSRLYQDESRAQLDEVLTVLDESRDQLKVLRGYLDESRIHLGQTDANLDKSRAQLEETSIYRESLSDQLNRTESLYQEAIALSGELMTTAFDLEILAMVVQASSDQAATNAILYEDRLNKVTELYNQSVILSQQINESRDQAAISAALSEGRLNQTSELYNQSVNLSQEVAAIRDQAVLSAGQTEDDLRKARALYNQTMALSNDIRSSAKMLEDWKLAVENSSESDINAVSS